MRAVEKSAAGFEQLGSYLLVRPLGKGGMGVVYVARTEREDRPLAALKRLRPDCARIPSFAERFRHEGELALRLAHNNIVETLDVGEVDRVQYVASELVLGKDLGAISERIAETESGIPQELAVRILLDALHGLAYVHNAREKDGTWLKLVHRDITPGNLLVGYDGVTRIADFGLASSALTENLGLTQQGTIMGTPKYLAPEVVLGQKAGQAADIYGLGAIMYRLLTGVAPYEGSPRDVVEQIIARPPEPLRELRPDLSNRLIELIDLMMARELEARPSSAMNLASDLESRRFGLRAGSQAELGDWLVEVFAAEHAREMREAAEIRAIDPSRYAKGVGTRVLRLVTKERFASARATDRAPVPIVAELPTLDSTIVPALGAAVPSIGGRAPRPELVATRIDREYAIPGTEPIVEHARVEEPRTAIKVEAPRPPSIEHSRSERTFPEPRVQRQATESLRPVTPAVPLPSQIASGTRWNVVLLSVIIALVASTAGVFLGISMVPEPPIEPSVKIQIYELRERLGVVRKDFARLEGDGAAMPANLDERVTAANRELDEADVEGAQKIILELEYQAAKTRR